jgi:hypothetical protein
VRLLAKYHCDFRGLKECFLKISTAIIGLGKIGLTYDFDEIGSPRPDQVMTHCRAISKSDFFEISYLIDSQIEAIQMAVRHYGGVGFQSVGEAQSQESPKLVVLSVPTPLHLETIKVIQEKWNPDVYLIEKPFGSSSDEARQIRNLLGSQDVNVYVNYFRRYLPNFISLVSSPFLRDRGILHSVTINAYGSLTNIFSHFLDLLICLESSFALGLNSKLTNSSSTENLRFMDSVSGIDFELNGIGQDKRECEMTLVYSSIVIKMTSNGRCFEILDGQGNSIAVFRLDPSIFDSYQAIVLARIGEEFGAKTVNSSVEDAICIHEFIESIGLLRAKV